jgi:dihydrodipicolinate synthase/N-acetylneuraminate lyase
MSAPLSGIIPPVATPLLEVDHLDYAGCDRLLEHMVAAETIALAERAAKAGAYAIVLAPPFYFGLTQPELLGYIERLVPALPLPVFLYNTFLQMPGALSAHVLAEPYRPFEGEAAGIRLDVRELQSLVAKLEAPLSR